MTWQPIETAPKDGTHILVIIEDAVVEAWWDENEGYRSEWSTPSLSSHGCGCCSGNNDEPTHWMPLPVRPSN